MIADALPLEVGKARYWVLRSPDGTEEKTVEVRRTLLGYDVAFYDGDGDQTSLTLVDNLHVFYVDEGPDAGLRIVLDLLMETTIKLPDRIVVEHGVRDA